VCPVMERCLNCDKDFPLFELQGHLHLCQKNEKHCLVRSPECPEEGYVPFWKQKQQLCYCKLNNTTFGI
ncbi:hypothetical protein XENORESO_019890, partial [Xenotaenia resolanae]